MVDLLYNWQQMDLVRYSITAISSRQKVKKLLLYSSSYHGARLMIDVIFYVFSNTVYYSTLSRFIFIIVYIYDIKSYVYFYSRIYMCKQLTYNCSQYSSILMKKFCNTAKIPGAVIPFYRRQSTSTWKLWTLLRRRTEESSGNSHHRCCLLSAIEKHPQKHDCNSTKKNNYRTHR